MASHGVPFQTRWRKNIICCYFFILFSLLFPVVFLFLRVCVSLFVCFSVFVWGRGERGGSGAQGKQHFGRLVPYSDMDPVGPRANNFSGDSYPTRIGTQWAPGNRRKSKKTGANRRTSTENLRKPKRKTMEIDEHKNLKKR